MTSSVDIFKRVLLKVTTKAFSFSLYRTNTSGILVRHIDIFKFQSNENILSRTTIVSVISDLVDFFVFFFKFIRYKLS